MPLTGYLHTHAFHYFAGKMGLLLLAAVLGALIGYERERLERPAGLRTHMLVCIGAALIAVTDDRSGARVVAQVVTGVGFLGAGTIMRDTTTGGVRGLTTAASVWTVAAIGIAVGFGFPYAGIATATTVLVFVILTSLVPFETFMNKRRRRQQINLIVNTGKEPLQELSAILHMIRATGVHTHNLDIQDVAGGQKLTLGLTLVGDTNRVKVERCINDMPQVVNYEWND